jgi:hypothetical protein
MLAETDQDTSTSILHQLSGLEPGWHSGPDAAWQLAGPDYEGRSAVLRELGRLYKEGVLERIHIWLKDRPVPAYWNGVSI